ncbi:hypothetical protein DYB25_009320, partial [Aphanomyces astaci]
MSVPNDVNVLGYPSFDVPSFPLNGLTLATKHAMASALETTGMISLREVPGFQAARRRYLEAAADCATSNPVDFDQLLSKTLMDGTIRRTLSINMNGVHDAIADRCPEFATSHAQYTTVVNHATAKFAAALDSINDDLTADHLLPIVHEGHHLDHFHAYSNTGSETSKTETSAPLSLELHADAGLMIIMAKPLFFARAEGGVRSVENPNEKQAGLVIQVDGNLVRPDLKDDELYLMVGEGLRLWGNFGFHFHPVVHGMVMPKEADASVVRAFAGRMLLLPSTKKMTNTGLTFGAYLNATTRYLKHESGVESAMSLACPVGRVLQASDESCTLGLWEPDEGSTATKEQCMRQCNIWGHPSDAKKCVAMKCKKVGEEMGAAASATQFNYPTFDIPAFDLTDDISPEEVSRLVHNLQTTGIMAIKNIPNFEAIRFEYLRSAAECSSTKFDQLLHKELVDGTQRRTLSTNTAGVTPEVADRCPAYALAHTAYTKVLDQETIKWATLLDNVGNSTFKSSSSSSLASIAVNGSHLDHFHGYTNPVQDVPSSLELSLEMHEDAGLAILTSAPLFFDQTADGSVVQVPNPDENTGLVIVVDGERVRPVLKANELVIMTGQGFESWGDFGHAFHPVLHGMIMPRNAPSSVVRAFSGRMLLLLAHQTMKNTGMTFNDYNHAVTRHLMAEDDSVVPLACPVGRILTASDSICTLGNWVPGPDSTATKKECMAKCNNLHFLNQCKQMKCIENGSIAGVSCWMVCVAPLGPELCPAPGKEVCK